MLINQKTWGWVIDDPSPCLLVSILPLRDLTTEAAHRCCSLFQTVTNARIRSLIIQTETLRIEHIVVVHRDGVIENYGL
jgi:hypothetical protein